MLNSEDLVLVTGAAGFVATHIVQQLLQAGYRVRGTVRSMKNEEKMKPLYQLCPEANDKLEIMEAELLDDQIWADVMKGCTYVIHVASPFVIEEPKDENELIKPAVEGTINVLRASQEAGTVKRVVLTSSMAAIYHSDAVTGNKPLTENNWSDVNHHTMYSYAKSKTLAERAAWDFIDAIEDESKIELAVINPSLVFGPVLCGGYSASMDIPKILLNREMPFLPNVVFGCCDVRDVAKAHINAMTVPEAAGHRHIVDNGSLWMREIAEIVDTEFKPQGYNIPTSTAWNFLIRIVGVFDRQAKVMGRLLDIIPVFDNSRMKNVLGITPYPVEESILEICYDMIETGRIKKTTEYRGRNH